MSFSNSNTWFVGDKSRYVTINYHSLYNGGEYMAGVERPVIASSANRGSFVTDTLLSNITSLWLWQPPLSSGMIYQLVSGLELRCSYLTRGLFALFLTEFFSFAVSTTAYSFCKRMFCSSFYLFLVPCTLIHGITALSCSTTFVVAGTLEEAGQERPRSFSLVAATCTSAM
jgi:hypothetical protein